MENLKPGASGEIAADAGKLGMKRTTVRGWERDPR